MVLVHLPLIILPNISPVISQYTANEIKQITPRVKNKISIVYNPYNEVIHFHPKEFRKENPHILHIGTGMQQKSATHNKSIHATYPVH